MQFVGIQTLVPLGALFTTFKKIGDVGLNAGKCLWRLLANEHHQLEELGGITAIPGFNSAMVQAAMELFRKFLPLNPANDVYIRIAGVAAEFWIYRRLRLQNEDALKRLFKSKRRIKKLKQKLQLIRLERMFAQRRRNQENDMEQP